MDGKDSGDRGSSIAGGFVVLRVVWFMWRVCGSFWILFLKRVRS